MLNVVDELSASEAFAPAAHMARELLTAIEAGPVTDAVFHAKLGELRECVRSLERTGLSEALARTTPRIVTGRSASAA